MFDKKDSYEEEMNRIRNGSKNDQRIRELREEIELNRRSMNNIDLKERQEIEEKHGYNSPLREKMTEKIKYDERVKEKIEKLERELKECEKIQAKEKAEQAEKDRKNKFKQVKNIWKKRSVWDRTVATIQGRRPNFFKVSKFSEKELEHLIDVSHGITSYQQKSFRDARDRNDKKNEYEKISEKEMLKKEHRQKWNKFLTEMKNDEIRKINMDYEDKYGGRFR